MIQETKEIKSTEFVPLSEFLSVKPKELETEIKSDSGIILEQNRSCLDRPGSGEVLAVGKDITDIKPGDYVVFPNTQGIDVEFSDGKFLLLRYKDLIGFKKRAE